MYALIFQWLFLLWDLALILKKAKCLMNINFCMDILAKRLLNISKHYTLCILRQSLVYLIFYLLTRRLHWSVEEETSKWIGFRWKIYSFSVYSFLRNYQWTEIVAIGNLFFVHQSVDQNSSRFYSKLKVRFLMSTKWHQIHLIQAKSWHVGVSK